MADRGADAAAPAAAPPPPAEGASAAVDDDDELPTLEASLVRGHEEDAAKAAAAPDEADEAAGAVADLTLNKKADVYNLNLAHQETDRILDEVEAYCDTVLQAGGPDTWIPVDGMVPLLCTDLGYEDNDQFEDALGGTFRAFLEAMPHLQVKVQEDECPDKGKVVVRRLPGPDIPRPTTMTIPISKSQVSGRSQMATAVPTCTWPRVYVCCTSRAAILKDTHSTGVPGPMAYAVQSTGRCFADT